MTAVEERPTVAAVLRAVGKASLLALLPEEEARMLAGPVARAEAEVPFTREDETAAARQLQAVRDVLGPPLARLGVSIPPPPVPVAARPTQTSQALSPILWIVAGGLIVVRSPFALHDLMESLPGREWSKGRKAWLFPATPAAAATLLTALDPYGPRVSEGVRELAADHAGALAARAALADDAPEPEYDGAGHVNMKLWTHQRRFVTFGENTAGMMFAAKMGCFLPDTPILTPRGWCKLGELVIGDEVFGSDGQATAVTKVHDYPSAQTYRVTFCDGTSITCTADHLWTVHRYTDFKNGYNRGRPATRVVELAEIITDGLFRVNGAGRQDPKWFLPAQPVVDDDEMEPTDALPVDPWLLGALLGDGSLRSTSPILYAPEPWLHSETARVVAPLGLRCVPISARCRAGREIEGRTIVTGSAVGSLTGVRIVQDEPRPAGKPNPLTVALRELGVWGACGPAKAVPTRYLTASARARGELLRGLMDTDGTARSGRNSGAEFCSRSKQLADDVAFLVRSLGGRARVSWYDGPKAWYVHVRFWSDWVPFRMPVKVQTYRKPVRNPWRTIRTVEKLDTQAVRCISVASESRTYLAGSELIPSHNSGKTGGIIALANKIEAHRILIMAPNRVRRVWLREVHERSSVAWHIADGTRAKKVGKGRMDLPHPERVAEATRVLYDCDCGAPVHAFCLNYEALGESVWQRWTPPEPLDLLVYDEAHRLKNYIQKHRRKVQGLSVEELRRRAAKDLPKWTVSGLAGEWRAITKRVIAATGTPMPQYPWDLFGSYRAIDPGIFGSVWTQFRDRYLEMSRDGTHPIRVKPEMMAEFAAKVMSIMYRPTVDLQLPSITEVRRVAQLEVDARRAYDQLDTELWADLTRMLARQRAARRRRPLVEFDPSGDGEVELDGAPAELTAVNILSRLLRLQQLTGGTLRTDPVEGPDGRPVPGPEVRVSTVKADLLAEVLEGVGCVVPPSGAPDGAVPEPVVVFARFTSDLAAVREVAEAAGLRYGEISGNRDDGLDADGRMSVGVDVVGVQVQAGGTGVDLTRARYGVWYSLGYSVSDYDQARARLHRPGQARPVVMVHLLVEDTQDEAVYDAIEARRAAVSAVLRAGGVEPEAVGVLEPDPGPAAAAGADLDSAAAAVRLPWE